MVAGEIENAADLEKPVVLDIPLAVAVTWVMNPDNVAQALEMYSGHARFRILIP